MIRAFLRRLWYSHEFGIVIPQGIRSIMKQVPEILEDGENGLPGMM